MLVFEAKLEGLAQQYERLDEASGNCCGTTALHFSKLLQMWGSHQEVFESKNTSLSLLWFCTLTRLECSN